VPTQEKVDTIEDLKSRLDGVKTVLLAEYRGLTVHQLAELRKQLKKDGLLTSDSRIKERKKYGLAGARKRFQFSKR